jgi:drug/metabolite transporter (DMT)-like permease
MVHITPRVIFLLVLPTLLWAGNAIVGRMSVGLVSPILLNTVRWFLAALILLPLGWRVFSAKSALWTHRLRFILLGLFGVGSYNALLYLSLQTSTPINVTLIGASMPIWMILIGSIFYKEKAQSRQIIGALVSLLGVAVVLSRGHLSAILGVNLVIGDLYMVLATISWGFYSWMLSKPDSSNERTWPWAEFLLAQIVCGLAWSSIFAGVELVSSSTHFEPNLKVFLVLLYIAVGPSLIAYRCWGLGVQAVGPSIAAFFANLIPLFAAIMSSAMLGEPPQLFHGFAFALIVVGILLSSKLKLRT